ncbi:hypothetical protein QFZ52_001387 [Arthrobacter woluwensis]|nr:hypothetical protein [Arthrobacter woluwensis]
MTKRLDPGELLAHYIEHMSVSAEAALDVLREAKVPLDPGLSASQIGILEDRFSFRFGPDHAGLLSLAVPRGPGWVDWLGDRTEIDARFSAPVDGVLFDVRHNVFWPEEWGDRPSDVFTALREAREHLADTPKLVPLYAHRFLPAPSGSPVLSVHQTDVIHYGSDLLAYLQKEFLGIPDEQQSEHHVEFWSDLADGRWL